MTTHQQYIKDKLPFVIRGGAKKIKAYNKWTDEYLIEAYGDKLLEVESALDNRFNPDCPVAETADILDMTIKKFMDLYSSNNKRTEGILTNATSVTEDKMQYYLASPDMTDKLKEDIRRPDLLKLINSMRKQKKRRPLDTQLFLGCNNNVSPMHTDSYHNFYHMLDGEKEIFLVPSKYTRLMRPYAKFNQLKIADIENIDYEKYPNMKYVPITKIHLKKGDLLYIPFECWHQMRGGLGRNLAVALWF